MVDNEKPLERRLTHDGIVHHPLGGGSYVFKKGYVDFLTGYIPRSSATTSDYSVKIKKSQLNEYPAALLRLGFFIIWLDISPKKK